MEAQKNTKKYWVLFFTWFVILIALFVVYREFFWLALPGTLTYFAKAMDLFNRLNKSNTIFHKRPALDFRAGLFLKIIDLKS